jgi:RHS repeat-associated protein
MTDPNGLVTQFRYDLRGRLVSRDVGGRVMTVTYTPAGQLLRVTQPDGSWVARQYDAAQRWVGLIDSAGQRIAYTLDAKGQRIREEHFDAASASVYQQGWDHDALGRVVAELDAQGSTRWRHAYDANGNRTSSTDALGQSTTRTYDALDRLRSSVDPLGASTGYVYDARDNLLRVTDPRGVVTQYTFDGLDNLTQESSPDSGAQTFAYDTAGNVRQRTWGNGRAVSVTRDALNRTLREDYGAGVVVTYAYDSTPNGIGRLAATGDNAGGNAWAYDVWGAVTLARRTTGARVLDVGYAYDAAGRLAAMTYPSGRVINYAYDSAGRVTALAVDGQPLLAGISWQPFGGATGWTQGNGRAVGRSFDRDGRLTAQSFDGGTRRYDYDPKGRIRLIDEPWGSRTFSYDAADRITAEVTWSGAWTYAWDGNGNRLSQTTPFGSTSYGYVAGTNRLANASGLDERTFTHDGAGNITAEGGFSFGYDARNRLALASSTSATTQYAHDALGRRVLKSGSLGTRHFAHDEQRKLIGDYDDSGSISETVWLGSMPVAVLRAGSTYWIDADQIDAPRVVRDVNDQIVWRWRSEAFGTQQAEPNPTGAEPFEFNLRFPGQWFDGETALHHNDQRDYRAHTGRYMQSDPIGLLDGTNRYSYARGNPVSLSDATGLACGSGPTEILVPDSFGSGLVDFTAACLKHDDCYGRCGSNKTRCDEGLRSDMRTACLDAYRSGRLHFMLSECMQRANLYFAAVQRFGEGPFTRAQRECKNCK